MIQTHCPDADRLRALITDPELPDYADLETHLAHCSRCQARLDEIAVGDSGWLKDAGRLATGTRTDPELTKTLHRLHDFGPDDSHVPPISLDFLTPSSQPGLLGTLGRYQVLDVIGRGAMGIVLKAIDPDLLRPVAIKVLAPYLASSGTARQRFLREARAAAAVSHDHIVTIHAVEPGELPYIVMEFISGISLQARLDRDGPLPPRDIARIGLQAANGLAAAHAVGLVHRDIKPANILLENGVERVKITDFGLARAADDARLTQSGTAAGTPLYMSPEQTRGETVDNRSDLFSLGSVLYTLATGFPPFRAGSTMGVLNRIANDPPRPIRETVPDFPAALEAIIMQLLEKDPARRFQVAADVSVKLTGYLNDPQAEPRRPRRLRKVPEWLGITLPIWAGIAVLGTVLVINSPKGTIVVESDDPNVKVAIDGEEVVLSGTGVAQVRVKPGEYHVRATREGQAVTADPETVAISRDGKQVVKITVKPLTKPTAPTGAGTIAPTTDTLLERRLKTIVPDPTADRLDLMRSALKAGRAKVDIGALVWDPAVPATHPQFKKLTELVIEGASGETAPDRVKAALKEAYDLAGTILKDVPPVVPVRGGSLKPDPEWGPKLDALMKTYQDLVRRFAATSAGTLMLTPGPIKDPDQAVKAVPEADRELVKRALALRDQFGLLIPRVQIAAAKLNDLRGKAPPAEVEKASAGLKVQYEALAKALSDMEALANQFGGKPVTVDPATTDWDARLKKLSDEGQNLLDQAGKTSIGRVLTLADKERQTFLAGLTGDDEKRAQRLLYVRDEFTKVTEQFRKAIGPWEQARLAARTARIKEAAGAIPSTEREKAELTLKDAERTLTGAEKALEKVMAELRPLVSALKTAHTWDAADAEFKKILAEYDALNLRLVNTPIGRVLAIVEVDDASESTIRDSGVAEVGLPTARKLLGLRFKIRKQRTDAESTLFSMSRRAELGQPESPELLQAFKFRNGALRGLIDDLKKIADELDPPPTVESEFKKVMAEYDALVLRLAKNPVGRALALFPADKVRTADKFNEAFPNPYELGQAKRLLDKRGQILAQVDAMQKALNDRSSALARQKQAEHELADPATRTQIAEAIQKAEHDAKVATAALRTLVDDLKKMADGIDPPKGK